MRHRSSGLYLMHCVVDMGGLFANCQLAVSCGFVFAASGSASGGTRWQVTTHYGPGKTAALAGTSGCLVWFGTCVWLVVMPLSNCWQQRLQVTLQHPTPINHFTDALPRPLQKSRSVCKRQCKLLGSVDQLGAVTGLFDRLSHALP